LNFLRRIFSFLFGRKSEVKVLAEGSSEGKGEPSKRRYVRIKRDIRILSSKIPGYQTITRDISLGGVKVELKKPLPKGKIIEITLDLETRRSTEGVNLKAEVVWIRQAGRIWEAGLRFIYSSPAQKEEIENYLKYLIETQRALMEGRDYHR